MQNAFYNLHLNHQQLLEIHRALLQRYVVEEAMRREQGLEGIEYPRLVEHLEQVLGLSGEKAHELFHLEEETLWEYTWYTFTDEWAWYRARQDVMKHLGPKAQRTGRKVLEELIEKQYEEKFEEYLKEVDMQDNEGKKQATRNRLQKNK
jgi:hypothetical protein